MTIGILLVTHGQYGHSLLQNAADVLNRQLPQIAALGLSPQDDPRDLMPEAARLLGSVDSGAGVLVLTDIWGASPSNLAARLLAAGRVEGVAGVNLPMLLRALTYREKGMPTLLNKTVSGGRDGVLKMHGAG
jgi:PTS system ascorbate-specific IIA component